jgi:Ca2+-transporting ATPase
MTKTLFPSNGLSSAEAAQRFLRNGPNETHDTTGRTFWRLALEVLREPMFLLLFACGVLYWVLGDQQEALILLGFVFFIMTITITQDWKTERALTALRDLSSPRAVVVRDGIQHRIPGREVVVGDLLILSEGDRVAADARVVSASHLAVDESLLTGESVPVSKRPDDESVSFVYASTLIVQGQGMAHVSATGSSTEVGKIGVALQSLPAEPTPLQKETHALVARLAVGALILSAAVVVVYGITRGDWLNGLLAGLTLAMAILPNEFPLVLILFLSLGAWRLSRKNVLTRRMGAVETLGAATVLCVDKTGTLTQNRMSLHTLHSAGETHRMDQGTIPPHLHALIETSLRASQPNPVDPMENALFLLAPPRTNDSPHGRPDWVRVHEYPLSRGLQAMSNLWTQSGSPLAFAAAKGAPEAIFDLCHLTEDERHPLLKVLKSLTGEGLRVLGVAQAEPPAESRPTNQHDFDFQFMGLLGFSDPVRPGVPQAVADAQKAGLRVVMITGDHPGTALQVAREIGLADAGAVVTGSELAPLSEKDLRSLVRTVSVFARVVPEQKLRLVQALKANGEIVVMTGDGVNDAPALKAAHIGIAMGERGTDVAREAADLVLLDDNFASLVAGVRLGRRVFDNLKKGLAYILAVHIPIAGMTLIPVALKWPLILLPVHIAFLHLIIDPAGSVVFESEREENAIMSRPPRKSTEPLFSRSLWITCLLQGGIVLVVVMTLYAVALYRGRPVDEARAITFTALIVANLGLIFANRSWTRAGWGKGLFRNASLWWVTLGAALFLALVLAIPALRTLFHFSKLNSRDLFVCVLAGTASVAWPEIFKKKKGHL